MYVRYWGNITVGELRSCLTQMEAFIESSPRPLVHAISDVGDIIQPVPFKDSLRIVREVGPHPRSGWTLNIREKSSLVRMGSGLGASVFKLRFRAFDTLDEAIAHLKLFDPALSWEHIDPSVTKYISNSIAEIRGV